MAGVEIIPSAKRLIRSLRDMGYDFAQAVADIVDNSIEAGAQRIAIDIEFDGDDSWVRISDNGKGMKPGLLREAMRYGAEGAYGEDSLGKFGLGLKTASMSQCQRLSVASRWNPNRGDVSAYSWDLDHVEKTNRWEILPLERNSLRQTIREPLKDTTGTVVLWERLDRILGYKHPYGESARKFLSQTCREIELHLGMVFHRFLSGEIDGKRFKLLLNGNEVKPWDPFCRAEARTTGLQSINVPISHEGTVGHVLLEPFVLPHQELFSSPEAFRRASGPGSWNQQQGLYIYRAGRMIQSGGWSGLRARDEHVKLARIAVSFAPVWDEAFKVNVAKMRVQMPAVIRDALREAITPVVRLARETYDRKAMKRVTAQPIGVSSPIPAERIGARTTANPGTATSAPKEAAGNNGHIGGSSGRLTLREWSDLLLRAATAVERPVVQSVLAKLQI